MCAPTNCCAPSNLHQFHVQWVDDEVDIIHANSSACITTANAPSHGRRDGIACLLGCDLADFEFKSVIRDGFVPVFFKPIDNQLNITM